jgi:hypothetical protein
MATGVPASRSRLRPRSPPAKVRAMLPEDARPPRSKRPLHLPSLVVGLGLVVIGIGLLLDALDVADLGAGAIGPAVLAVIGLGLLASGVRARDRR